jgi:hypothetical protein
MPWGYPPAFAPRKMIDFRGLDAKWKSLGKLDQKEKISIMKFIFEIYFKNESIG